MSDSQGRDFAAHARQVDGGKIGKLDNPMSRRTPAFLAIAALAACSSRPETASYVERVTGLSICDDALIKNVPADENWYELGVTGFVYAVDISMSEECKEALLRSMIEAQESARKRGESISAVPLGSKIRITYAG
ncbi:MAG TPA: hypothetical protein VGW34_01770 [Allosphingosinicella sp.]|nr:hypothetical protein [Allosphingosinicella sp.]